MIILLVFALIFQSLSLLRFVSVKPVVSEDATDISARSSFLRLTPMETVVSNFHNTMEHHGYLADMLTVFGTNSLSDFIAQSAERRGTILK
jgi:hypothetical protein